MNIDMSVIVDNWYNIFYCREEIFYPTMKAIARQMGKEGEFEGLTLRSQVVLPPKGASEIDIRVQQVRIYLT